MDESIYQKLHSEGLISDESLKKTQQRFINPLFSIHWEIKTLLYIGILLLTAGLGTLVYKNIDSIGHQVVLLFIALICTGCFAYCFKNKLAFNAQKVGSPNAFFNYILVLACITFLIFTGYLQFEYKVFGTNYGMATFIPMLVLFFSAYYFDHIGILNMAIANLAVWLGVSVTPKQLLLDSDFDSQTIIYTYLFLGIFLLAAALATQKLNFKRHFKFSYQHYGVHLAFIALLAGYFHFYELPGALTWMLGVALMALYVYRDAFINKSFYFLLLVVLYSYIAISSLAVRIAFTVDNIGAVYLLFLYFIGSGTALIFLLINLNKKLKAA